MKKLVIGYVQKYGQGMVQDGDKKLSVGEWVIYHYGSTTQYNLEVTFGRNYPKEGNHYWWQNCPRKREVVELLEKEYGKV